MRKGAHLLAVGVPLALALICAPDRAATQAIANNETDVSVEHPRYPIGAGPIVAIDEGHNNYHTLKGRYAPFGAVLKNDGYRLTSLQGRIDSAAFGATRILVVANPLATSTVGNWKLPTPSAFGDDEIGILQAWVRNGGALFLIADHMPFAGAATDLGRAFGFQFDNAYAVKGDGRSPEFFSRAADSLSDNAITHGSGRRPAVDEVQTFNGSSFRAPPTAMPIMRLDEGWTLLYPTEAGKFDAATRRRAATRDDLRGAALKYGKGRVVVVSEAALFTNQLVQGKPYGFGQSSARQDKQFLLNIIEWLGGAPGVK
jgi:hypothetical protein